jgi:hypothetical protein
LNCDQLVTLLREFEVAVNRAGGELVFVGWLQRQSPFGFLAPTVTAFLISESCLPSALLFCHGCVPGSFMHWLVGLYMALTVFPLRASSLAWCRLKQFYWYTNLGALKAYILTSYSCFC